MLLVSSTLYGAWGAGAMVSTVQDAAVTNIPTTYAAAGGTFHNTGANYSHIAVINDTGTAIRLCFNTTSPAGCSDDAYLPANQAMALDDVLIRAVFVKSDGAAITAGTVWVGVWQ